MSENQTPAQAAKATAKKAAPKPAAKKAPAKKAPASGAVSTKLRWQFENGFDKRAETGQSAAFNGGLLEMRPVAGGKWVARFVKAGKTQTLAENCGAAKAYTACVNFSKGVEVAA